jgi:hypothetical protein
VDPSVCSQHSEPEGEFRDDYDDDSFFCIPQPPPAPNIVNVGAGPCIVPEGDILFQAPEGAAVPPAPNFGRRTRSHACQHPPASWICGADGKLEHVNLIELKRQKAMENGKTQQRYICSYI